MTPAEWVEAVAKLDPNDRDLELRRLRISLMDDLRASLALGDTWSVPAMAHGEKQVDQLLARLALQLRDLTGQTMQ